MSSQNPEQDPDRQNWPNYDPEPQVDPDDPDGEQPQPEPLQPGQTVQQVVNPPQE